MRGRGEPIVQKEMSKEINLIVSSDPDNGAVNITSDRSAFTVKFEGAGFQVDKDAYNITLAVEESTIWWNIPNIIDNVNNKIYIFGDDDTLPVPVPQLYTITIPQGLYDLDGLNLTITNELEAQGARTLDASNNALPLITFTEDLSTSKSRLRFNYPNVYVDFSQPNTFREILGFNSAVYGPFVGAPLSILADKTAAFNQINYFLIHSDLVKDGIRFNNQYNQTISQVLIDVPAGSQIVSKPFNPAKCDASNLENNSLSSVRFWITDDKQRPVNVSEFDYWSARIVVRYKVMA